MDEPSAGQAPQLWQQLLLAAQGLRAVRGGQSARTAPQGWPPHLRPGAQALLNHSLRHLGTAQALRQRLAQRKPAALADALLCTALAVLLRPQEMAYDDHTLVNQTVLAARNHHQTRAQAGFVNGCLRRFLRERQALEASVAVVVEAEWNHPAWWVERLQQQYPGQWQAILQAGNSRAPLSLRVNTTQITRADYAGRLRQAGLTAWTATGTDAGLLLPQAVDVRALPGFAEGWFSVQDAGAQRAAPLLLQGLRAEGSRPLHVLDACAAPGGKTAHLLEYAQGSGQRMELLALDVDAQRCQRIHENLQRLRLQATVVAADAGDVAGWNHLLPDRGGLDAILLDAPCTASGIVRRHPDVRWLRRADDVPRLAQTQQRLLRQLWPLLRVGGRLLYCTCSVFHEEGQNQMHVFLAQHADARLKMPAQHLLPTSFHGGLPPAVALDSVADHDGFFYGLLEKHA